MKANIENEPIARKAFGDEFDEVVRECGLCIPDPRHKRFDFLGDMRFAALHLGASADGIYDNKVLGNGVLEIKCPQILSRLLKETAQPRLEYQVQLRANMAVIGANHASLYYWTPLETLRLDVVQSPQFLEETLPSLIDFLVYQVIPRSTESDLVLPDDPELQDFYWTSRKNFYAQNAIF
jgi:hypothetical protein